MQPRLMMRSTIEGMHLAEPMAWPRLMMRELWVSWRFIGGDVSSAVIPPLLFLVAASGHEGLGALEVAWGLCRGLLYFWLFTYAFNLSNQLVGVEEDRVNKPHRPLVRGEVTVKGTRRRWWVSMALLSLVGWGFGVWEWALLWQVLLVVHNEAGAAKHWWAKNLLIALGVVTQLAAAWQLVGPLTAETWRWIAVLASVVFLLVSLQDLRDLEGDRASGRKTFPLVFGEKRTRYVLGTLFGVLPLIIHEALMKPQGLTPVVAACDAGLALVSWVIAVRVVGWRTKQEDHRTYLLFTYWYCLALLSTIVVL
ncbi:UbiA family prenyltransferase [Archangium lansingense]|uniref:UbiA family prenyltransferase n=1 Tax=Archangium lansingense TaxID=2995310 RepID=A0ABT4AP40_9BACT|nr:UbiA family prenyltransferase [Archangium lansinium]MCY1083477.1 UbiA family prenyltransferase [Archangium lansinium]